MAKAQLILGIILLVFGIVAVIAGIVQYFVIKDAIKSTVIENLTVTSESSEGYEDFVSDDLTDPDTGLLYKVNFWNLTNPNEVLNGTAPNFVSVGPYTYRRRSIKTNIVFSADATEVTYQEYGNYTFEAALSAPGADEFSDLFTNINPVWLGILAGAGGSEYGLYLGGLPKGFSTMWAAVTGNTTSSFPPALAVFSAPTIFQTAMSTAIAGLMGPPLNMPAPQAQATFWAEWANSSSSSSAYGIPNFLRLATGQAQDLPTAGGVLTLSDITSKILNASVPYSLASEDPTALSSLVFLSVTPAAYPALANSIQTALGLDVPSTKYYIEWRVKTLNAATKVQLTNLYGLTSYEQIGLLHWATPQGLVRGRSFKDFDAGLPGIPELGIFASRTTNNTVQVGNLPIANITHIFNVATSGNVAALVGFMQGLINPFAPYVTAQNDTQALRLYITQNLLPNFVKTEADKIYRGAVFLKASPHAQLFGRVDPLLIGLGRPGDVNGVFTDFQYIDSSDPVPERYTTGKDDSTKAGLRLTYNGSTEIPLYNPPQPVQGSGDLSWVGPGRLNVESPEPLKLFVSQVARDLDLTFLVDYTVKEIPTKRYTASRQSAAFLKSTVWNNPSDFLLNLERLYNTKIFFSLPAFYLVDPAITTDLITGVTPDPELHDIFFDFEPITGLAIRAYAPLQGSLYLDSSAFNGPHAGIAANRYYPLYWIIRNAEITDEDAESLKAAVVDRSEAILSALIVLVVLGGLAIIAGIIFLILFFVAKRSSDEGSNVEMH